MQVSIIIIYMCKRKTLDNPLPASVHPLQILQIRASMNKPVTSRLCYDKSLTCVPFQFQLSLRLSKISLYSVSFSFSAKNSTQYSEVARI